MSRSFFDASPFRNGLFWALALVGLCVLSLLFFRVMPLFADNAYTFFRLLQAHEINLQDLRSINPLSLLLCKGAVFLGFSAKNVALVYCFSFWAYVVMVYLVCRYVFLYKKSFLLLLSSFTVLCFCKIEAYTFLTNGMFFCVLAFASLFGERSFANKDMDGKLLLFLIFSALGILCSSLYVLPVVLCVFFAPRSEPIATPILASYSNSLETCPASGSPIPVFKKTTKIALSLILIALAIILFKLLPEPIYFRQDNFFALNAEVFLGLAFCFYLLLRIVVSKEYLPFVLLGLSLCAFAAYAFYCGYIPFLAPFFLAIMFFLLLKMHFDGEKNLKLFYVLGFLAICFCLVDKNKIYQERLGLYSKIYGKLETCATSSSNNALDNYNKFILYDAIDLEEYLKGNAWSINPETEFLNYSLIFGNHPKVCLFASKNKAERNLDVYEADVFLPLGGKMFLQYKNMNPRYFASLARLGGVYIAPKNFFEFTTYARLESSAEEIDFDSGGNALFHCETIVEKLGFRDGPRLAERRSNDCAYHGKHSVKLNLENRRAFECKLQMREGDSVYVEVMHCGSAGKLILMEIETHGNKTGKKEFLHEAKAPKSESWQNLKLSAEIPKGVSSLLVFVDICQDASSESQNAYFDCLKIEAKRSELEQ